MIITSPVLFILFFIQDLTFTTSIPADATYATSFYAPIPQHDVQHVDPLLNQAYLFGAFHVLGYPFTKFPTTHEHAGWLIASLAITLLPLTWRLFAGLLNLILVFLYKPTRAQRRLGLEHWLSPKVYNRVTFGKWFLQVILSFPYVAAKVIILVLAVVSLRQPDGGVHCVLRVEWDQWIQLIPHIS